jgi:hypothetical protein
MLFLVADPDYGLRLGLLSVPDRTYPDPQGLSVTVIRVGFLYRKDFPGGHSVII